MLSRLGNIKCEHQVLLAYIAVLVVTWHFPGFENHDGILQVFELEGRIFSYALTVCRAIKWHGLTSNACYSIRSLPCVYLDSGSFQLFPYSNRKPHWGNKKTEKWSLLRINISSPGINPVDFTSFPFLIRNKPKF